MVSTFVIVMLAWFTDGCVVYTLGSIWKWESGKTYVVDWFDLSWPDNLFWVLHTQSPGNRTAIKYPELCCPLPSIILVKLLHWKLQVQNNMPKYSKYKLPKFSYNFTIYHSVLTQLKLYSYHFTIYNVLCTTLLNIFTIYMCTCLQ